MTIHEAHQKLLFQLYHIYDSNEAEAIANLVMENLVGWKKIDRIINKYVPLSIPQLELFEKYLQELSTHKPVQYILQEAWFCNLKFYVDENVLIPRPETEELVEWIAEEVRSKKLKVRMKEQGTSDKKQDPPFTIHHSPLTILDIGTGSGCIPVALKKKLDNVNIYSCDISEKALEVAKRNALSNNAGINFLHLDFLNNEQRNELPSCNIIVSNPPYIPANDKSSIPNNVINFEPHIALFVNDDDPLIFYNVIADFALEKLLSNGIVYAELHEDLFSNVKKLFLQKGFQGVTIKKDLLGKHRMLKATMLP
ncbi:MAG TPA: peptide chain release factor N(5)-glutamine methyltransferase [Puia sp.]|jgi:release factor glutamine methyltransferase|nr:peptide chain release factor N(5)-glutamine methyltransferase [Puia sp.]